MPTYKHSPKSKGGNDYIKESNRADGGYLIPKIDNPAGGTGVQETTLITDAYMESITSGIYKDHNK